jgi:hypothetical protein
MSLLYMLMTIAASGLELFRTYLGLLAGSLNIPTKCSPRLGKFYSFLVGDSLAAEEDKRVLRAR